jgi:PadR family transcriptional regulator PadR
MASRPGINTETAFENLLLELRRGSLVLAVLQSLNVELYGYTLRSRLAEAGIEIDEGTLYPLLRRLESQGLLTSEWRDDDKRRKRFYLLSTAGKRVLTRLIEEWRALNASVEALVKPPRRTPAQGELR